MTETLYRFFDDEGNLLYVGISNSFYTRANQHRKNSDWFEKASMVTLEHFEDRDSVEEAEKLAIRNEHPIHNKMHSLRNEKPREHFENFWDVTSQHQDEWHSKINDLALEHYKEAKQQISYLYAEHVKAWAIRSAFREITNSGGDEIEGIRCISCESLNKASFFDSAVSNFWLDAKGHIVGGN